MYSPTAHTLTHTCTHSHPHTTHTYCTSRQALRQSSHGQLDNISSMLDDGGGICMTHLFCTVPIDLQQLTPHLQGHTHKKGGHEDTCTGSGVLTLSLSSLSAAPPGAILSTQRGALYSAPPLMLKPKPMPSLWISMCSMSSSSLEGWGGGRCFYIRVLHTSTLHDTHNTQCCN